MISLIICACSAFTLLVGQQKGWWGSGVVICLEKSADLLKVPDATATHCLLLE